MGVGGSGLRSRKKTFVGDTVNGSPLRIPVVVLLVGTAVGMPVGLDVDMVDIAVVGPRVSNSCSNCHPIGKSVGTLADGKAVRVADGADVAPPPAIGTGCLFLGGSGAGAAVYQSALLLESLP